MNKVMIFPFWIENKEEARGVELTNDCELGALVSLPGWNRDLECLIGGKEYRITYDFWEALDMCDILWLCEHPAKLPNGLLHQYVSAAIAQKKKVWVGMQLEKEDMNLLKELDSTGELLIFPPEPPMDWYYMYQKLSTPVIAVGGFSQGTGKFAMEIAITKGFAAQGFKPLLVASRPDAAFWGHEALPSYFFDDSIPDNKKIMALNYYFSKLEHLKRPDVFIVGIPGALLPNDLDYFYDFATLSFQISQAVELDDIIMSYPCLGVAETFFSEMELRSESLLGAPICFHNIIGKVFDASNSRELEHLNYTCMDDAYIQAELQKYSAPNISSDCLEKDYAVRICRDLIERHA